MMTSLLLPCLLIGAAQPVPYSTDLSSEILEEVRSAWERLSGVTLEQQPFRDKNRFLLELKDAKGFTGAKAEERRAAALALSLIHI